MGRGGRSSRRVEGSHGSLDPLAVVLKEDGR